MKRQATNLGTRLLIETLAVSSHMSLAAEAHSVVSMGDKSKRTAAEVALLRGPKRGRLSVLEALLRAVELAASASRCLESTVDKEQLLTVRAFHRCVADGRCTHGQPSGATTTQ